MKIATFSVAPTPAKTFTCEIWETATSRFVGKNVPSLYIVKMTGRTDKILHSKEHAFSEFFKLVSAIVAMGEDILP